MELFHKTNAIRLKSYHDKYLVAEKDEESVSQDRKGKSSKIASWNVELVQGGKFIRLKSCYGKYLTASDAPFLLGMKGKKVVQTLSTGLDSSSLEWQPIRSVDGHQFKLKSRMSGDYLRANGSLPPWRNSVTHDVPHRNRTQDWILWDVDALEVLQQSQPEEPIVELAVEVEVEVEVAVEVEVVVAVAAEAEVEVVVVVEEEADVEGESPSSRFGFRKFLHKLSGGDGEEEQAEEVQEEGSSSSRFGFRKFLHKLSGGDGEEEQAEEEVQEEGSSSSRFGFRKFLHELDQW